MLGKLRGDRVKERREQFGLSQEELASRVGVSLSQIWRYEKASSDISGTVLAKLIVELDCSAEYLLGLADTPHGTYKPEAMSNEERKLLTAYRRGDLSEALLILSQRVGQNGKQGE